MPPLFGHKDDAPAAPPDDGALRAEVERLDALTLPALGAEVMAKGFGPGSRGADEDDSITTGGPNINSGPEASDISYRFIQDDVRGAEHLRLQLNRLVAEGLQALEHASLVRAQMHTSMNGLDYALTRLGRSAIEQGAVERILGGGSL